jgi:hypothetical protein
MPIQGTDRPPDNLGWYEVPDDVYETLPDGRVVQLAVKGASMPLGEAQRLGMVKASQPVEPQELKGTHYSVGAPPRETRAAPGPATGEPQVFAPNLPEDTARQAAPAEDAAAGNAVTSAPEAEPGRRTAREK